MSKTTTAPKYQVGQRVECQTLRPDLVKIDYMPATVEAVELLDNGLTEIRVRFDHNDGAKVVRIGKRGGGRTIR